MGVDGATRFLRYQLADSIGAPRARATAAMDRRTLASQGRAHPRDHVAHPSRSRVPSLTESCAITHGVVSPSLTESYRHHSRSHVVGAHGVTSSEPTESRRRSTHAASAHGVTPPPHESPARQTESTRTKPLRPTQLGPYTEGSPPVRPTATPSPNARPKNRPHLVDPPTTRLTSYWR